jgi:hypothetical protein
MNVDTSNGLHENALENRIVENKASGKRRCYVSLGTVFNEKPEVFETLIHAFNSDELQTENLDVIVVTGDVS